MPQRNARIPLNLIASPMSVVSIYLSRLYSRAWGSFFSPILFGGFSPFLQVKLNEPLLSALYPGDAAYASISFFSCIQGLQAKRELLLQETRYVQT